MDYALHLVTVFSIWAILAMSYNLIAGTAGMISLAHGAFFAFGAYGSALVSMLGVPLPIALLVGVVAAATPAVVALVPAFSLHHESFLVVTLVLHFLVLDVIRNLATVTGGTQGIPGLRPLPGGGFSQAALVSVITLMLGLLMRFVSASALGRRLRALREDSVLAESLGIHVLGTRALGLALGGAMAGGAGAIMAHYYTYIDPTYFGMDVSVLVAVMVFVGGLDSIGGAVVGAGLVVLLPEGLRQVGLSVGTAGAIRQILFGGALILVLVYRPRGLFGRIEVDAGG